MVSDFKRLLGWAYKRVKGVPVNAWVDPSYDHFYRIYQEKLHGRLAAECSVAFKAPCVFSIVMPVYRSNLSWLEAAVHSVFEQVYPSFELILVNASPEVRALADQLEMWEKQDSRVKVVTLERNFGIAENTARGIDVAKGDFICFLDHDDMLDPWALWLYARRLDDDSTVDVLYCDEDMVEERHGALVHMNPMIKPDYSPELLLSTNYIVHFMAIRTSLVRTNAPDAIERVEGAFDGSQDYAMLLRVLEKTDYVAHIPEILYHWRISPHSTATNPDSKPYMNRSSRLVLAERINHRNLDAVIIGSGVANLHGVWFSQSGSDGAGMVSLIVDARSSVCAAAEGAVFAEHLQQVNTYKDLETIVILDEEGSCVTPDGMTAIEEACNQSISMPASATHLAAWNEGARIAKGDILLFMDVHTLFESACPIEQMVGLLSLEGVGVVGPKILNMDMTVRSYGLVVNDQGVFPLNAGAMRDDAGYLCCLRSYGDMSALGAECLALSKEHFNQVGGFPVDRGTLLGCASLCLALRSLGMRCVVTPTVECVLERNVRSQKHGIYLSYADDPEYTYTELDVFDREWGALRAKGDPYYNHLFDQRTGYYQLPKK